MSRPMTKASGERLQSPRKRRLRQRLVASGLLVLVFAVLAAVTPALSDYQLEIGFRLLLLIALAEAWNLLAGYGGMVSLGTAAFFGIGAYMFAAVVNQTGMPYGAALLIAGGAAALAALLLSRAVLRLRGLYFTVGTFAVSEALRLFMTNYQAFGGAAGVFVQVDTPTQQVMYVLALLLLALTTLMVGMFTNSRLSVLLRAVRDDEEAAAQIGVKPFRIKLLAFMLSSFIMGAAGGLQAFKLGAIEPYGTFGLAWTVNVLSVVLIGGMGRRAGPAVGAVLIVALGEWLADYPALHIALSGLALILVIRFAPRGLVGAVPAMRSLWKRA
jgi:branched-chain amino acid transport system permease protein